MRYAAVDIGSNSTRMLAAEVVPGSAPVELAQDREEARLIHQGVMSRWPQTGKRVLLVDIGGGSAEIISSEDGTMLDATSKQLGALRLQEMFLHGDPPAARELHQMTEFVDEKLEA